MTERLQNWWLALSLRERWLVGDEVSDSALYGLLASDPRG